MRILDVGSGHHPHPQATVLADLSIGESEHRDGEKATLDQRPFVVCSVDALPFRNNIFCVVWCSNVIEHTENPKTTLTELKRVAKHGYVTYPTLFFELVLSRNWKMHNWVISNRKARSMKTPFVRGCKKTFSFLWDRNFNLRFRERVLARILPRIRDEMITW